MIDVDLKFGTPFLSELYPRAVSDIHMFLKLVREQWDMKMLVNLKSNKWPRLNVGRPILTNKIAREPNFTKASGAYFWISHEYLKLFINLK